MEQPKTKFRRLIYRAKRWFSEERLILTIAIVICLFWTWQAISAMTRNWGLEQRLVARRQELTLLQLEIDSLELENQYYASEEYQELAARARHNKIKEGESLVYLPDNTDYANHKHSEVLATAETPEEPSNFEQWLSFIFGS